MGAQDQPALLPICSAFGSREPRYQTPFQLPRSPAHRKIGAWKVLDLQGKIGAPGFELGTSPTRIMGEIHPANGKALQIALL